MTSVTLKLCTLLYKITLPWNRFFGFQLRFYLFWFCLLYLHHGLELVLPAPRIYIVGMNLKAIWRREDCAIDLVNRHMVRMEYLKISMSRFRSNHLSLQPKQKARSLAPYQLHGDMWPLMTLNNWETFSCTYID